jgi:hypothetical protein
MANRILSSSKYGNQYTFGLSIPFAVSIPFALSMSKREPSFDGLRMNAGVFCVLNQDLVRG